MSLTQEDLLQIRGIVREEVGSVVSREIEPVRSEIQALRNDIKEIYDMIARLEKHSIKLDAAFARLPVKEQLLQLNAALVALAKKEGITLPR